MTGGGGGGGGGGEGGGGGAAAPGDGQMRHSRSTESHVTPPGDVATGAI